MVAQLQAERGEQAAKLDELRRRSVAEGDTLRGKVASLDASLLEAKQGARAAGQQAATPPPLSPDPNPNASVHGVARYT